MSTATQSTIRVMTYNVHRCIGVDRRLAPERIADVIQQARADVVALQEVDACRPRTRGVDQAGVIAQRLDMTMHFHPALQVAEEQYGDAVLSRFPMRLVQAGPLPRPRTRLWRELRGALWTSIQVNHHEVQLVNTHLGLGPRERMAQTEALFSEAWLGNAACKSPLILCGDFNALPDSAVHRRCLRTLRDVHRCLAVPLPRKTFPTRYPMASIDHLFLSAEFSVRHVEVLRTPLTRVASDHYPLIVELSL
jgi:endonuclease/exonuclease/phosphatase family metal-dependent hydrolase